MAGSKNDVVVGKNADFSQAGAPNATTSEANGLMTNGQVWVGTTAVNAGGTHINVLTLTAGTGITLTQGPTTFTIALAGGGTAVETLTGNSGVATPSANNINVITSNTTVKFAGSGSTLTQDFGLSNLALGSSMPALTSGAANSCFGLQTGIAISSGAANSLFGQGAGKAINTAQANTAIGASALTNFTSGAANAGSNTAVGNSSLNNASTGIQNTAVGDNSISQITTGRNNIGIGYFAGNSHTLGDSSNIDIGNTGTVGQSNTIRIGTQGTGTGQQNQTFIAGVINTVSGRVVNITTPGAYPYTTLITDYVILVDSSVARTITPLAAPVTGTTYRIKDNVGSAAANNITITPSGKNIDGAASFTIAANWGSVDIVYNGTQWNCL